MKRFCWTLFLVILSIDVAQAEDRQTTDSQNYLFSYFLRNGEDGLHLAHSTDGYTWKALHQGKPLLQPQVGRDKLMRDPSIQRGPDGRFHMVWTVSWGERGIGYASSNDLIDWSPQRYLGVMEEEPEAQNCWAPELFHDAANEQFLICWSTTIPGRFPETDNQSNTGPPAPGRNHRIYYVTTKDFQTFSKTRLLYDRGFNVIDAAIVQDGARYAMFLKDETNKPFPPQKNIRVAFSDHAVGPYGDPSPSISGTDWVEGPTAIKIGPKWHVYYDKYRKGVYGLLVSTDLVHWTEESDRLVVPQGMRHGTVFETTPEIVQGLRELDESNLRKEESANR